MNSYNTITDRPTRTRARVIVLLLVATLAILIQLAATLPAQAQTVRPKVPICRVHNGVRYCLPTHGGSGITPPFFRPVRQTPQR